MRGFLLGLLADRAVVEDVLHEVFLTVTAKAGNFVPGSDFLAWARAIARFKASEARRKRFPAAQGLDDAAWQAVADAAPVLDEGWESRREALSICLDDLAPRARQVIDLRYSAPILTMDEIARRMSWGVGAVKVALTRARQALRDCVERKLAQQDRPAPSLASPSPSIRLEA